MDPTQGALIRCVYCEHVRPGIGDGCPRCNGAQTRFVPARMMDPESARDSLLQALFEVGREGGAGAPLVAGRRDHLLALLEAVAVHSFDLTQALAEEIRRLEEDPDVG